MSIGNMPEDELDDLFRKAASEYNPEFDPDAWQAMERKLDMPLAPSGFFNWWRISGLVIFLFLVSVGIWVGYKNSPASIKPAGNLSGQPVAAGKNTTQANPSAAVRPAAPYVTPTGTSATKPVLKGTSTTVNRLNPELATVRSLTVPGNTRRLGAAKRAGAANLMAGVERKKPAPVEITKDQAGENQVGAQLPADSLAHTTLTNAASTGLAAPDTGTQVAQPGSIQPDSSLVPVSSVAADSVNRAAAKEKKSFLSRSRLSVSLVAAPDLTAVGFTNPGGISTNAGVLVGYYFAPKWRLAAGVITARKVYKAHSNDYGNSYEFWKNRHIPDDIEAVCQVLDIPVNIGYQVWQKGQNSLMVNTGLSSYLMRREKYTYEYYAYGGNNGYTSHWQVKNQNKHLFSIYNLSVGYARQLTRGVLVGVEPFVKVPLAGVGAGKIKLASAGVFFSLSYRWPE